MKRSGDGPLGASDPDAALVERDADLEPERRGTADRVGPRTTSALAQLAQDQQVTLNTVVLGAWALL